MMGVCPKCGALLAAPLPADAPLDAAERARLQSLLVGQAGFSHVMQHHREIVAGLMPVLGQIQAFLGCGFFEAANKEAAAELAQTEAQLCADLVAWLQRPERRKVSKVEPAAPAVN